VISRACDRRFPPPPAPERLENQCIGGTVQI
jgi:hypothetical protein